LKFEKMRRKRKKFRKLKSKKHSIDALKNKLLLKIGKSIV